MTGTIMVRTNWSDAAVDRWLREVVVPAYDKFVADSSRAIPAEDVIKMIRELHADRVKKRSR